MSQTLSRLRALTDEEANKLHPGDMHYRAYVGPPEQYDLMGATQFGLLCSLGLREWHRVLDFGCGSLRVGRLLIPFLRQGCYYGIDPSKWLIDDAISHHVTEALVALKKPTFLHHADFNAARAGDSFDFIVAQSIFSHAGPDILETILKGFRHAMSADGLAVVTAIHPGPSIVERPGTGWTYPECITYRPEDFTTIIAQAGLFERRIPWFHPRQTWHVLAKRPERLPPARHDHLLAGAILNVPDWAESLSAQQIPEPD